MFELLLGKALRKTTTRMRERELTPSSSSSSLEGSTCMYVSKRKRKSGPLKMQRNDKEEVTICQKLRLDLMRAVWCILQRKLKMKGLFLNIIKNQAFPPNLLPEMKSLTFCVLTANEVAQPSLLLLRRAVNNNIKQY